MKTMFYFLTALSLVLSACASAAAAAPIKITDKDAGSTVEMKLDDTLEVTLEGNPSTGYSWVIAPMEPAILVQQGEPEYKASSDLLGAPGTIIEKFTANAKGQTTLRLEYKRPWENNVAPEKTFEVTIVVK